MKTRLDRLMVERGLAETAEKAQALIMAGDVRLNGQKASRRGKLSRAIVRSNSLRNPRTSVAAGLNSPGHCGTGR